MDKSGLQVKNIVLAGVMAALVYASFFLNIPLSLGIGKTMLTMGNVTCVIAGLLLGPVAGGLTAGIGAFFFDLLGGWASTAIFSLIIKFLLAFVCGLIAYGGKSNGLQFWRSAIGAFAGMVINIILYMLQTYLLALLTMSGSAQESAVPIALLWTFFVYLVNAVIAIVVGLPIVFALRKALNAAHIGQGT